MKKIVSKMVLGLLIGLLVSCGSSAKVDSNETIDLKEAIARSAADIMKRVPSNTTIAFFNISAGDYSVVAEFVIEEISGILVDKAKLIVVDRNNMDVIDAEHAFQMSGRVSDDAIISIAKKYGAASVVSCSVAGEFDLRRLRVRALDVETGKVLSLTSHSVKNLSDYARPQSGTQRSVQPAPAQIPLAERNEWHANTLSAGTTHYYRFQAGDNSDHFIEWRDSDTSYGDADIAVGVKMDGSSSYIVPISDGGNNGSNKHLIKTTPGVSYIIEVKGVGSTGSGTYAIRHHSSKTYQIGDRGPAGGIVFYDKGNFNDGWRYLEAAPADMEMKNLRWGTYGIDVIGTRTDLGTGKSNTRIIIQYLRSKNESGMAAQVCAESNIGNFADWFLPSREELHWMYLNLHNKGLGRFKNARYWSSSQADKNRAWYLHFGDNGRASNNYDKDRDGAFLSSGEIWTRAVRSFM